MSGSTTEWSLPGSEPRSVADARHWLAGRLALVTGASRGIGAATAEAIAAAGARVVLAARTGEQLDDVARRIREAGGEAMPVPTDVSRLGEVERLLDAVGSVGRLAALVCAAGVLRPAPFVETTLEAWEETLGVNLTGSFLCCRAAFDAMRPGGEGRIVNIASLSGIYATEKFPGLSAYNVSTSRARSTASAPSASVRAPSTPRCCVRPIPSFVPASRPTRWRN
jgi:NAD(P)-dependent dehydrogenase (short-subunit alcohol dehydrogenase family)